MMMRLAVVLAVILLLPRAAAAAPITLSFESLGNHSIWLTDEGLTADIDVFCTHPTWFPDRLYLRFTTGALLNRTFVTGPSNNPVTIYNYAAGSFEMELTWLVDGVLRSGTVTAPLGPLTLEIEELDPPSYYQWDYPKSVGDANVGFGTISDALATYLGVSRRTGPIDLGWWFENIQGAPTDATREVWHVVSIPLVSFDTTPIPEPALLPLLVLGLLGAGLRASKGHVWTS